MSKAHCRSKTVACWLAIQVSDFIYRVPGILIWLLIARSMNYNDNTILNTSYTMMNTAHKNNCLVMFHKFVTNHIFKNWAIHFMWDELLYLHLNFSVREFILFFSAFFLIGRKWARTRTKSGKLTISFSLAPLNFPPSSSSLFEESRKNAWTILSPNGLMANSGIRKKSSRVKCPFCCLSKLVNRLHSLSIWLAVTKIDKKGDYFI